LEAELGRRLGLGAGEGTGAAAPVLGAASMGAGVAAAGRGTGTAGVVAMGARVASREYEVFSVVPVKHLPNGPSFAPIGLIRMF
jgi:hypothetical protein